MIKSIEELKDLILWAKAQKVKSLKLGEIIVELSDLALIEDIQEPKAAGNPNVTASVSTFLEDLTGTGNSKEDEDLLYWSAKN